MWRICRTIWRGCWGERRQLRPGPDQRSSCGRLPGSHAESRKATAFRQISLVHRKSNRDGPARGAVGPVANCFGQFTEEQWVTPEGLAAGIALFEPRHFVTPFLAHALGTLVGAFVAYLLAASHKARFAYAIGVLFLMGGIAACFMIPAPAWFMALDLVVAYLPMAWLAIALGARISKPNPPQA